MPTNNQLLQLPIIVEHIHRKYSMINNKVIIVMLYIYFNLNYLHLLRRARPTLKPSNTIVSKAQEFVDIYRYPPVRPDPLYPQPQPDKTAAKCRKDVCLLPDCYCGGRDIPGKVNSQ